MVNFRPSPSISTRIVQSADVAAAIKKALLSPDADAWASSAPVPQIMLLDSQYACVPLNDWHKILTYMSDMDSVYGPLIPHWTLSGKYRHAPIDMAEPFKAMVAELCGLNGVGVARSPERARQMARLKILPFADIALVVGERDTRSRGVRIAFVEQQWTRHSPVWCNCDSCSWWTYNFSIRNGTPRYTGGSYSMQDGIITI